MNETDSFIITSDAHPNVLTQPKQFANTKYYDLLFQDDDGSTIGILSALNSTTLYFTGNHSMALGVPVNFKSYFLVFEDDVKFSDTEIDSILQWNYATRLWISADNVIALQLQERISQLAGLKRMNQMTISVSADTYEKLRLKAFVDALETLKTVYFVRARSMTVDQFNEFKKSQTLPARWRCTAYEDFLYICNGKGGKKSIY